MGISGNAARIAPSADVDPRAFVGYGNSIWHLAQVREDASLGANHESDVAS